MNEDIEVAKLTLLCMKYLESGPQTIPKSFTMNSALECHNYVNQKADYLRNWQKKLQLNEYTSVFSNIETVLDSVVLEERVCPLEVTETYLSESIIKLSFLEITLDKIIKEFEY